LKSSFVEFAKISQNPYLYSIEWPSAEQIYDKFRKKQRPKKNGFTSQKRAAFAFVLRILVAEKPNPPKNRAFSAKFEICRIYVCTVWPISEKLQTPSEQSNIVTKKDRNEVIVLILSSLL
jgi:hypothetical protein